MSNSTSNQGPEGQGKAEGSSMMYIIIALVALIVCCCCSISSSISSGLGFSMSKKDE